MTVKRTERGSKMDIYDIPKKPIKSNFDEELKIAINNIENKNKSNHINIMFINNNIPRTLNIKKEGENNDICYV